LNGKIHEARTNFSDARQKIAESQFRMFLTHEHPRLDSAPCEGNEKLMMKARNVKVPLKAPFGFQEFNELGQMSFIHCGSFQFQVQPSIWRQEIEKFF
jgi:hypothetical protein